MYQETMFSGLIRPKNTDETVKFLDKIHRLIPLEIFDCLDLFSSLFWYKKHFFSVHFLSFRA